MSQGRIVWMDACYSGVGEVADVGPGHFNGPKYIEILVEVLLPSVETRLYPENAPFHLVQDNSPVHKCRVVQQVGRTDGHNDVLAKFACLLGHFQKQLRKIGKTANGSGGKVTPKWEFFQACSYFMPVNSSMKTVSSFQCLLDTENEEIIYEGSLEDLLEAPQCSKKRTAEDPVVREEALQIDATSTSPVTEPTTTPSPQFSTPSLSLMPSPIPSLESCLTPRAKKQKTTPNKNNVADDMTVETFKVSAKDDGCSTEQGARLGNRNCSTFC
ncbi:hypothetical protein Pcinc_017388 [Petrolisthes cinctipes]|uniref:Uncharacterized protein n=1 Tax=Petrolisthes cinctipes TaxID=88211 RepID=A0AAE1FPB7_PETCI|nr:hypothetical protein Pcinc_017388 [Petrolisthes cinctipes]